ncbi:hypothetical protein AGMMS49579_15200 [Spirochaetia bacterium]|nr:hypothetical protein AGMMS49579_15200 [Spirochaetia bacterium]
MTDQLIIVDKLNGLDNPLYKTSITIAADTYDYIRNNLNIRYICTTCINNIVHFYVKKIGEPLCVVEEEIKYTTFSNLIKNEITGNYHDIYSLIVDKNVLTTHTFIKNNITRYKIIYGYYLNQECICYDLIKKTYYSIADYNDYQYHSIYQYHKIYRYYMRNTIKGDIIHWIIFINTKCICNCDCNFCEGKLYHPESDIKEQNVLNSCKICLENKINTLFIPCLHVASCQKCSVKLKDCHICKEYIIDRVRVFIS